jgi:hypothetical protein
MHEFMKVMNNETKALTPESVSCIFVATRETFFSMDFFALSRIARFWSTSVT